MPRPLLKGLFIFPILIAFLSVSSCLAAKPITVPTFHSIGLYYSPEDGSENNACHVQYKILGENGWKPGQDLWFDSRNGEYRGSLVNLTPGVTYVIKLILEDSGKSRRVIASTWKEQFPIGDIVYLPSGTYGQTLQINTSGTADAYRLYTSPEGADTIIDVAGGADHCLEISASYVIIRGLELKNAGIHGIRIMPGAHDVIIEGCDISGWGRIAADGWGENEDAGIYSNAEDIQRIIIQRNRIHHPRSDSNSWKEERSVYGYHPAGPKAISLKASAGNHVIRYNEIFSDDEHYFNDAIGEWGNFGPGFPNADTDIYGNWIERSWDDGIESEGHNRNVRIWCNYIDRSTIAIAAAPVHEGPLYIWRNVMHSSRKGPEPEHNYGQPLIKLGGGQKDASSPYKGDGKTYIFHNTSLIPNSNTGLAGHSTQINGDSRPLRNVVTRNNILESAGSGHYAIYNRTEDPQNDFDWDLYNGLIYWGENLFELNGIQSRPLFPGGVGFVRETGIGYFQQTAVSPGYDTGVTIANFNDDFTGLAPDMGAHEADSPPMRFGTEASYLTPPGLVGRWAFDEKRRFVTVIDKSGNGNIGVMHGDVLREKGQIGRSIKLNGVESYVEVIDPGMSALDVSGDISVALWVKRTNDTAGDQWFASKPGCFAWKFSNTRPYFYLYSPDGSLITPEAAPVESSPLPVDVWHHLAAVYDTAKQQLSIYINGVLDVAVEPVSGPIATNDENLLLGHRTDASLWGNIDELHLYDRAINVEEIQRLAGITPDNTLAAHFELDEGQGIEASDISGNDNLAKLHGDTAWFPGISGTGLRFDGNGDYVEITDRSDSLTLDGSFSLAVWIKCEQGTNGDQYFLGKPGTYGWYIGNSRPYFVIYTPEATVVEPSQLVLHRWYHLAAVYDQINQTVSLYIDGQLDAIATVTGEPGAMPYPHMLGNTSNACFMGVLDDVRIYRKALSVTEVQTIYGEPESSTLVGHWTMDDAAGTDVTDTSGNGNHGTLHGDVTWAAAGRFGSALQFGGPYSYVHIPDASKDLNLTGSLSISLWIKRMEATTGDEWFISKDFAFKWKFSNSTPHLYLWLPDETRFDPEPGTRIEADGQWHHMVAIYDADAAQISIYIDNAHNITHPVSGQIPASQEDLFLGTSNDGGIIGMIDEVRIYNKVLSESEINELFMGN